MDKKKKNSKKIIYILLFILCILLIITAIIFIKPQDKKVASKGITKNTDKVETKVESTSNYKKFKLKDGILYSKTGKLKKADIVLEDTYFDTTINDMYLNYETYKGKIIEVSGMHLTAANYTFVGRYSTSNLCPNCPAGYSYLEYQLDGKMDAELTKEKSWIKVQGTLEKGNDESSDYQDYYYLKVINLEIMNERGKETVSN